MTKSYKFAVSFAITHDCVRSCNLPSSRSLPSLREPCPQLQSALCFVIMRLLCHATVYNRFVLLVPRCACVSLKRRRQQRLQLAWQTQRSCRCVCPKKQPNQSVSVSVCETRQYTTIKYNPSALCFCFPCVSVYVPVSEPTTAQQCQQGLHGRRKRDKSWSTAHEFRHKAEVAHQPTAQPVAKRARAQQQKKGSGHERDQRRAYPSETA